jgi:hypothetical protein
LEVVAAGTRGCIAATAECYDDRHDVVAVRDQPAGDRINEARNERCAECRRGQTQQDGAAKGIIELSHGHAGETSVEPLHCGNEGGRTGDCGKYEASPFAQAESCGGKISAPRRRDLKARAQSAPCQYERHQQGYTRKQRARRVTHAVIGVVRERVIADDVDRVMRERCCSRRPAERERNERRNTDARGAAF